MTTNKKYTSRRRTTFAVMAVYLFIIVAHLFFAPAFQYKTLNGNNISVKKDTLMIYTLIRTNRCMVNNDKIAEVLTKQHPAFFTVLLFEPGVFTSMPTGYSPLNQVAGNGHLAYLYNRVLRI